MDDIKNFFADYQAFVDDVTSPTSKDDVAFDVRKKEISEWLGGNFARFDTAVAGIAGEAGEVADAWKKLKFHNKELSVENRQKIVDELGDICWYLAQASLALNVTMDELITGNIEKLKKRHPNGFSGEYMKK